MMIQVEKVNKILPQLVHGDQSGFARRSITDNLIRTLLTQDVQILSRELALISLDAKKTFDRVSWSYLFKTLWKKTI